MSVDIRKMIVVMVAFTMASGVLPGIGGGRAVAQEEQQGPPPGGPPTSPPKGPPERARIPADVPAEDARAVIDPPALPELPAAGNPANAFGDLEEAAARRRAQARMFRTPGGGIHAAQISSGPMHYEDDNGQWREIDTSIERVPRGYSNAGNSFSITLPEILDDESPIEIDFDEGTLRVFIEGAHSAAEAGDESVTYPDALPDTDLSYEMTPTGFVKLVSFNTADAPGSIRYRIETDLELVEGDSGEVEVRAAEGEVVSVIPPAFAEDDNVDERRGEGARNYDIGRSLGEQEPGSYLLEDTIPTEWLEDGEREFPVILDPSTVVNVGKDTFVQSNISSTSQGGSTELKLGSYESDGWPRAFTYLRFPLKDVRDLGDVIEKARLDIHNFHSWDGQEREVRVQRLKEWWPQSVTWPDKPAVHSKIWQSIDGCGANHGCPAWHKFNIRDLVQHWIDNYGNEGLRLWGPSPHPQSWKKYYSDDAGGSARPVLQIVANFFPDAPKVAAGAPGMADLPSAEIITTESPTLKLAEKVKDPNGDDVYVRFQVSPDPNDFTAGTRAYNSGWLRNTKTHVVPPGKLEDGKTYYWRAQSWDGYPIMGRERPTSADEPVFTISTRKFGSDPRWAMWTHGLGNDMELSVNQANGNLVLDYPLESATTPAEDLELSLAYNSQAAGDWGLSAGWEVAAGPASDPMDLPIRIRRLGGNKDDPHAVRVIYRDGTQRVYPHVAGMIFRGGGAGASVVRRHENDRGWKLTTSEGGVFAFDSDGRITSARPAAASHGSTSFSYAFDAEGHIQSVTDPIGRTVDFTWTSLVDADGTSVERLARVAMWDGREWILAYDSDARLVSVTDPKLDEVAFGYGPEGLLASVRDGESSGSVGALASEVSYVVPDGAPSTHVAVQDVTIAGSGAPYSFAYDYDASIPTKIARSTRLTDPRGHETGDDADDFVAITDFNRQGLPILTRGPRAVDGRWPEIRQFWDGNGNLLCRREPLANEVDPAHCLDEDTLNEPMNTKYVYEDKHPYRLVRVVEPQPEGISERLKRNYAYDESFDGLTTDFHDNRNLVGLPYDQRIWGKVRAAWGSGGPSPLDGRSDNFSLRWTGQIHADHSGSEADTYRFELFAEDNGRLQIGGRVLSECWGQDKQVYEANCGNGVAKHDLKPGWHNIVVEYQARTGDAEIDLKWKKPGGDWETIPRSYFRPHLGIITSESERSGGTDHSVTTYTYEAPAAGPAKIHGLPNEVTLSGENMQAMTEAFEYDEFGRVTNETDATGQAITHEYSDDPQGGSCETKTTDREGLVVEWECNPAGDVTDERVHVGPEHVRETHTAYDAVGRVVRIDHPAGGSTHRDYDAAGRLVEETVEVAGEGGVATESRTTTYDYTPQGWLATETLPAADEGEETDPPQVQHSYDAAGNEERTVDARGNEWSRSFDAANRQLSATDPTGETWVSEYDLAGNQTAEVDPAGVHAEASFDVLGRQTAETSRGTTTSFEHDTRGNVVREEDGDTYVERTFDGAGRVATESEPVAPGGDERTNTFTYDGAGRLTKVDDYQDHVADYTYDRMGRLKTATLPYDPAGDPPAAHVYSYNPAGELTKAELPTEAGASPVTYDYTYDVGGRLATETDGLGNEAAFHYNWAGELRRVDDPRGLTIRHGYDGRGRHVIRRADDSGGSVVAEEEFAYDAEDNMISASSDAAATEADYDPAGRLIEVREGGTTTTAYTFAQAQLAARADAAGTTTFSYRANGRLKSATDPFTGAATSFTYTSGGRLKTRSEPNGITHTFGYDAAGRVATATSDLQGTAIATYSYSYNEKSRLTAKDQDVAGSGDNGSWAYAYDPAGRLTRAEAPGGAVTTYDYDDSGNRTAVNGPDGLVETTYDVAGRPVSASDGTAFSHDAAGNLTAIDGPEDTWTYSYDPFNRLAQAAQSGGATHTFAYDALGRQVAKTTGSATTTYSYAGLDEELVEVAQPDVTTHLAYAEAAPLAQRAGGVTSFFGIDPSHSDVTFRTGEAGTIVSHTTYDPWGVPREASGEFSPLGFQSDPTDPDTGLVDMGARLYAPGLGRFTTSDPFRGDPERPATMNRYLYAHGAPTTNIDETGMYIPCEGANCKSPIHKSNKRRVKNVTSSTKSSAKRIYDFYTHNLAAKGLVNQPAPRAPKRLRADPGRQVYRTVPGGVARAEGVTGGRVIVASGVEIVAASQSRNGTRSWWMPSGPSSTRIRDVSNRGWHVARFTINIAPSAVGSVAAATGGARCELQRELIVVCTEMGHQALHNRGGTQYGNVFITHEIIVTESRRRHEAKHADQSAILGGGPLFPLLYGGAEVFWPGRQNPFERWAGLEDGGY